MSDGKHLIDRLSDAYESGETIIHRQVYTHPDARKSSKVILVDGGEAISDLGRYIVIGPHHTGVMTFHKLSEALHDVAYCLEQAKDSQPIYKKQEA